MAKSTAEENSERKRISIPKADESVLDWWDAQKDPGLSVRLLIRSEIERSGYTDTAYRPVAQLPRRGRPPVGAAEAEEASEDTGPAASPAVEVLAPPAAQPVVAPARVPAAQPIAEKRAEKPAQTEKSDGFRSIDDLMNS